MLPRTSAFNLETYAFPRNSAAVLSALVQRGNSEHMNEEKGWGVCVPPETA